MPFRITEHDASSCKPAPASPQDWRSKILQFPSPPCQLPSLSRPQCPHEQTSRCSFRCSQPLRWTCPRPRPRPRPCSRPRFRQCICTCSRPCHRYDTSNDPRAKFPNGVKRVGRRLRLESHSQMPKKTCYVLVRRAGVPNRILRHLGARSW